MSRRIAAAALTVVALFGLTACTGFPSPNAGTASPTVAPSATSAPSPTSDSGDADAQSTEEACQLIQDTVSEAASEFEQLTPEDPGAVAEAMTAAGERLSDAASRVSNEEVAALLAPLQETFERVAEVLNAAVEGDETRLTELPGITAELQEAGERFQEVCAPQ